MIYLFKSTHDVMTAEKIMRKNNFLFQIVPVPRSISSDCGMAIEIENKYSLQVELQIQNLIISKVEEYIK